MFSVRRGIQMFCYGRYKLLAFVALLIIVTSLVAPRVSAADCAALPTDKGTASFTVDVPSAGTYRLWTHMYSPSAGNNSVYVQVDNNYCQVKLGDSDAIPAQQFTWVDYQGADSSHKVDLSLSGGTHTITLAGLETAVGVDKVVLLDDLNCVPTGDGSTCVSSNASDTSSPAAAKNGSASGLPSSKTANKKGMGLPTWIWAVAGFLLLILLVLIAFTVLWMLRPVTARVLLDRMRALVLHKPAAMAAPQTQAVVFSANSNSLQSLYRNKKLRIIVPVIFAAIGGALVIATYAATPTISFLMSGAKLTGRAAVVDNSGAVGGKMVQFDVAPTQKTTATAPPKTSTSGGGSAATGSGGATNNSLALNLPRTAWEGGPSYYANFSKATAWNNPNFFPVGVWFESVTSQANTDLDKAAGLNTYFQLTDSTNMTFVRNAGMYAFTSGGRPNYGAETIGWEIQDEADMNYNAGNDAWDQNYADTVSSWNSCIPKQNVGGKCGYTVNRTLISQLPGAGNDGRLIYQNYGKGITFWESDAEASGFVNVFPTVLSDDLYWYTDPDICGSSLQGPSIGRGGANCRYANNYGWTMDQVRYIDGLDGKRKPIYAFIEDGCPFSNGGCINANQIAGAVFASLIHEARGVIYFNHNFGGSCISQHVLRDSCGSAVRPTVTSVNQKIKDLAPVLNTQSYQHSFNGSIDTMLKVYGDSYYIFAMQKTPNNSGTYTFTLPSDMKGANVQVLYENRSLPISGGKFTDSFAAEYAYHIYKITP